MFLTSISGEIYLFKKQTKIYLFWRLLRWWLETVWIPFLPFFYLFEKNCDLFMFSSHLFYIFRDKIRIWIKKNWWRLLDFFGLRRVIFSLLVFLCSVIICDVSWCFSRSSSVNGAKIQTSYYWYFNSNGGKSIGKVGNPAHILST